MRAIGPQVLAQSKRAHAILVLLATVGYLVVAAYFFLRRHDAFLSGFDVATFDQEIWLLANGHEPLNTQLGMLFWGEHFSLSLILLTPLYMRAPARRHSC